MKAIELVEFSNWLDGLRDKSTVSRIVSRILRLKNGHAGDHKAVGDGVLELRFTFGPGYRVYFTYFGDQLLILLAGGDKDSQFRDILKAKSLLKQWKELNHDNT